MRSGPVNSMLAKVEEVECLDDMGSEESRSEEEEKTLLQKWMTVAGGAIVQDCNVVNNLVKR